MGGQKGSGKQKGKGGLEKARRKMGKESRWKKARKVM